MSTINVETLQVNDVQNKDGVAAAFNFDGVPKTRSVINCTTAAITESVNLTSITDNGAGRFNHAYTNTFATSSYTQAGSAASAAASVNVTYARPRETGDILTTSINLDIGFTTPTTAGLFDYVYTSSLCAGDLA